MGVERPNNKAISKPPMRTYLEKVKAETEQVESLDKRLKPPKFLQSPKKAIFDGAINSQKNGVFHDFSNLGLA